MEKKTELSEDMEIVKKLMSITVAAEWATIYNEREISRSNISYLIQYGEIRKYLSSSNQTEIDVRELQEYYDAKVKSKEEMWKNSLGQDLNWDLSFDTLREKDTTKHVHRLHPYKGKFIPQLVEYFLDENTTEFKKEAYFKPGDTILDPFNGSGTTLVQASELGLNSVGIDISQFNCVLARAKNAKYDIDEIEKVLLFALDKTEEYIVENYNEGARDLLKERIAKFNRENFPNTVYKYKVKQGIITNPTKYSTKLENQFFNENEDLINQIDPSAMTHGQQSDEKWLDSDFLVKWYAPKILSELRFYNTLIDKVKDERTRSLMRVIMSRTARSCRSTTHSDLATLKEAQTDPYYCSKHYKICIPISTIKTRLKQYTNGTIRRLREYSTLRKDGVHHSVIHGDSRTVDIIARVKEMDAAFGEKLETKMLDGVFTSPPYVGQIDYHEQHAYAYELFAIERADELEIGPLFKGKGKTARDEYTKGIAAVLVNVAKYVKDDGDFFLVANDKYGLYPKIAELANMKIVAEHKRPVLNRTERSRAPYAEIIFHMKKNL